MFSGNLHCVPVLVKDNIDVKSVPTTAGLKAFEKLIPNKDAAVIELLKV